MPLSYENPSLFAACYFCCAEMNNFTVKCIEDNDGNAIKFRKHFLLKDTEVIS